MRIKAKLFYALVLAALTVFLSVGVALAEGENQDVFSQPYKEDSTGEYLGKVCSIGSDGSLIMPSNISDIVKNNPGSNTITIKKGNSSFQINVSDSGVKQLKEIGRNIYDKESVRRKVSSMGEQVNVQADTKGAGVMLSGLAPLVNLIVGIIAYLIILGMTFFTALDIIYITMPVFRNKAEEMRQAGSGILVRHDNKTGETKLRWVTDEAVYAVQACSVDSGKNPLGMYLQKRIWAYILVAIVIFILLTGNVQLFVNIALNLVEGILDVLANLGK